MGPVWALLLLLLLPIAQGAETFCDARLNNIQCYGALGGIIEIRLMDSGSTTERCIWKKNKNRIFEWRNNNLKTNDTRVTCGFNPRTGTFRMCNLSKNDSDSYKLEFIENGLIKKTLTHKLTIEAPVSSVHLEHQCLSKGEMRVTCTAEGGDSPEFSWTLNGQNLTDSQLLSKNEEDNITLRQNTEGLLRCSVKNHINEVYDERNISTCGYIFINCTINGTQLSDWVVKDNNTLCTEQTTTSPPITPVGKTSALTPNNQTTTSTSSPSAFYISTDVAVIAGAIAGVLGAGMAAIALVCVLKKKRNNRDEEHELTYADVRILQQPGRRPQPRASEMEVEYGQVRFSNQNQHVPQAADNACIYAMVRR